MIQDDTDQDNINRLSELYYAGFAKSFLEELNSGIYFDTEWPIQDDGSKREGNPIDDGLFILDSVALKELNSDYDYVSLYEAALIIGSRVRPECPECLIYEWKMFADAVLNEEIDPRTPGTYIPYSKDCGEFVKENDEIKATKKVIDMSWCLSLDEVAKFAIFKGYPEELFDDLLSHTSSELKTDKATDETKANAEAEKSSDELKIDVKDKKPLDPRERNTLLTIIYALCEKCEICPSDKGLARELELITEKLGGRRSERAIKEHLKNAFDLLGK